MSDGSPPTKKLKKLSTDISSSKNSDFLKDVANERKKVSKP
jgi:hypothetical protein